MIKKIFQLLIAILLTIVLSTLVSTSVAAEEWMLPQSEIIQSNTPFTLTLGGLTPDTCYSFHIRDSNGDAYYISTEHGEGTYANCEYYRALLNGKLDGKEEGKNVKRNVDRFGKPEGIEFKVWPYLASDQWGTETVVTIDKTFHAEGLGEGALGPGELLEEEKTGLKTGTYRFMLYKEERGFRQAHGLIVNWESICRTNPDCTEITFNVETPNESYKCPVCKEGYFFYSDKSQCCKSPDECQQPDASQVCSIDKCQAGFGCSISPPPGKAPCVIGQGIKLGPDGKPMLDSDGKPIYETIDTRPSVPVDKLQGTPGVRDQIAKCTVIPTAFGLTGVDPKQVVETLLRIILSFVGGIALLLIMYAGYKMVTSRGNPEQIESAKETLTSAIIGLLFIIFSVVILEVIGVDILAIPGFEAGTQDTNRLNDAERQRIEDRAPSRQDQQPGEQETPRNGDTNPPPVVEPEPPRSDTQVPLELLSIELVWDGNDVWNSQSGVLRPLKRGDVLIIYFNAPSFDHKYAWGIHEYYANKEGPCEPYTDTENAFDCTVPYTIPDDAPNPITIDVVDTATNPNQVVSAGPFVVEP